jgi:thioredoxin reductase (NADPH)
MKNIILLVFAILFKFSFGQTVTTDPSTVLQAFGEYLTDEENQMRAVTLKNLETGEQRELALKCVFVAIGHDPATTLFRGQLTLDAEGYLIVEPGTPKTVIPGVFAAGDVADKVYRQAVTAAGMGCMAALEAERFLAHGAHAGAHGEVLTA